MRKSLARFEKRPWRTGDRSEGGGRMIFAVLAEDGVTPGLHDPLIGLLDTPGLAEAAVRAHNRELSRKLD